MASEKAQRTKVALIEAANAIILEEGIDNLTLDRVAERAGLSKGALTYHFSSKRSLHAALIAHYVEHMNEEMEKYTSLFEGDDADRLVAGYVEWFKAFDRNNRGWATVGVTLISSFVHDKELMAPVTAWYEALYQRIERLPAEKQVPTILAVMTMEGFFYAHKFGVDFVSPKLKKALWPYLLEKVSAVDVKRKEQKVDY